MSDLGAVIEVPADINERLRADLRRGGRREIGGILMGECLEPGRFRVVDFTVDYEGGTDATFVRSLSPALQALDCFFDQTDHDYKSFNYLGEWHSHPSFALTPSTRDIESCQSIAEGPEVGANFVTLLVVRLGAGGKIESSATIFRPSVKAVPATLYMMGQ